MNPTFCSFCGKHSSKVGRLIAGPNVAICNECVALCADVIAESPPGSPPTGARDGRPHVLVRAPDGTVHACAQETDWVRLMHDGLVYEWCATRGQIRANELLHVVAVRRLGAEGPSTGLAYPLRVTLTEEHARAAVAQAGRGPDPER